MLFARNLFKKNEKKILDTTTKTGIYAIRQVSKKIVHKTAEAAGEFAENKINNKIMKLGLCDYGDAYIVLKGRVTVKGIVLNNRENRKLASKNNPPFRSSVSKINSTFIENEEGLDTVMWMYNLLEYSDNYSIKSIRYVKLL